MSVRAFISYSHADEKTLERLHKHLAVLQRDNLLTAWYDHAILPGANLAATINSELDRSDIFLALVSPDYLASNYCYDKEFQHAQALAEKGKLRIVAIIVEPCDWLSTPFANLMALPKDGKPIADWTNANTAYLDVVNGLRRILSESVGSTPMTLGISEGAPLRRVRVKRDFDSIERSEFADETFATMRDYFEAAAAELSQASEDLRTKFETMSATAFTCSLVNRASRRNGEAHITVHNGKGRRAGFGDISYVYEKYAGPNTSHGFIRVEADEYNLYLLTSDAWGSRDTPKHSPKQAAEWLWNQFVEKAGVDYE